VIAQTFRSPVKVTLALWPLAFAGCILLTLVRLGACNRDASSQGNAWTKDHSGYCTSSGWDALTAGPGSGTLTALALLALTAAWPASALVITGSIAALRDDARHLDRAWWIVAGGGAVLVVAFFLKWGHMTIVGGAGG
jgi:hypothetical protein